MLNWMCPLHHSYNDITLLLITSNVHDYETNHLLINKLVKRLTRDSLLFTYHTCINVSVNTIIAWYINIIINTKIYNNHLLLPLGHISNSGPPLQHSLVALVVAGITGGLG